MLNVNDLEKRWLNYKIKYYIPHIVIITSLSIVSILIYSIQNDKLFNKYTLVDKIINEDVKEKHEIKTKQDETIVYTTKKSNNQQLILTPSLNFISNIKHNSISHYENNTIYKKPKKKEIQAKKQKPKKIKNVEKKTIKINRQNAQKDISQVIKRFEKNNNPALSLFIAKKYYELGDYHKSYNYALITNEINDNIDASWIVFIKSLTKLNKKDEAIRTLKKYIEHSHSSQAKILLDEIISGKFK